MPSTIRSIAAIGLALVFLRPLLLLLGATEGILPYALTYARICLASSAFSLFNVTMNGIVTSEGSPRTTMYALLAGAVLNVILDPVFIYTLRLGIAGAAIATAISQFASTAIYLSYILGKRSSFSFKPGECSLERGILSEIFKTGVPVLLFGTTGIAYSQPVADILSIAVTIVMALRLERELTTMESKAGNAMPALYPAASFQQGNQ